MCFQFTRAAQSAHASRHASPASFVATTLALAMSCAFPTAAQTIDSVATVVVSGASIKSSVSQDYSPATLMSVSAEQLQVQNNTVTAAGVLQYLPSVHVRERYIGDRNAVLVMRVNSSIASAQTTVMADGLLLSNFLNNSFSTAPRWGMVSPEEIERVDVLYGPFSALYPGNSAGGVVNIISREPTQLEAHGKLDVFSEHFKLYGTDQTFNGNHESVSVGNRIGAWTIWAALNHLENRSHPQTFGNTTAKTGAAASAGTFTDVSGSPVIRDIDTAGKPRIIVSSTGIDDTVQDMAKLAVAYRPSANTRIKYSLGIWQNHSEGRVDSYLKDAAGNTVFNAGSAMANPLKYVRINGSDYTVSNAAPSSSRSEHWMHGLSVHAEEGDWTFDAIASVYDQVKDISRSATPNNGYDSALGAVKSGGQITYADSTGWQTLDLRARWGDAASGAHVVSFGAHVDRYELASITYGTAASPIADWTSSETGTLNTNSFGKTQTEAIYVQDEWRFAPRWLLMVGGRKESWRAFDGSNYNAANALPNPKNLVYADRSYSNFSPKMNVSWQLTPNLLTRASFGKAVRYPTVAEMFQTFNGPGSIRMNDPNLKPEQVYASELAVEQKFAGALARVSYFHEDKRDALISQTDVTVTPNISSIQNVDKLRTNGVEIAGEIADFWLRGLDLNGSVTYTDSKIVKDTRNPGLEGTLQPRIPDWRATFVATYRWSEVLSASLSYRFSGRQHNALFNTTTQQYNDPNPNVYGAVSHYSVFDAKLLYRIDARWSASVGINNLGNFKYYVNPNPYPHRTFFGSLKYDL